MQEVTTYFQKYRECVRHIWNTFFLPLKPDWDNRDHFSNISVLLFSSLICKPIGAPNKLISPDYLSNESILDSFIIQIKPESDVPVLINRQKPLSGYWDYPVSILNSKDVSLRFIKYFDFDTLGFRDFQYYQVRIVESVKHPDIVDRDALLKCEDAEVFFLSTP